MIQIDGLHLGAARMREFLKSLLTIGFRRKEWPSGKCLRLWVTRVASQHLAAVLVNTCRQHTGLRADATQDLCRGCPISGKQGGTAVGSNYIGDRAQLARDVLMEVNALVPNESSGSQ